MRSDGLGAQGLLVLQRGENQGAGSRAAYAARDGGLLRIGATGSTAAQVFGERHLLLPGQEADQPGLFVADFKR